MTIPRLAQIKTWAIAALGVLASIFGILFYRKKAQHESAKRKGVEEARKVEHEAQDEIQKGAQRKQEKVDEARAKADRGDRSHFESQ